MEEQIKTLRAKLIAKERDIDEWVQLVRTIRKHFVKETEYYENLVYELEMKLAQKDKQIEEGERDKEEAYVMGLDAGMHN